MCTPGRRRLRGGRGLPPHVSAQLVAAFMPGAFVMGLWLVVLLALAGVL